MTLKECIKKIEQVARDEKGINEIIPHTIYKLNENSDITYPVISWQQIQHTMTSYAFILFCCDLINENESNIVDIQSGAISHLKNIIKKLRKEGVINSDNDITFTSFTQQFIDNVAGVFCEIEIENFESPCENRF